MQKRWNTLKLTGYGALGGAAFMVVWISLNGPWRMALAPVYTQVLVSGAFGIACWAAIISVIRNFIVRPK